MKYALGTILMLTVPAAASAIPAGEFIDRLRATIKAATDRAANAHGGMNDAAAKAFVEDPELRPLVEQFAKVVKRYADAVEASNVAGKPRSCPPKTMTLTPDDLFVDIERLPTGWRTRELYDVVTEALDKRYPCAAPVVPPGPPLAPGEAPTVSYSMQGRTFDKAERAPVPIDIANDTISFAVTVNGQPATMVLDNGASATLIDSALADRLGLKRGEKLPGMRAGRSRLPAQVVDGVDLKIPGALALSGAAVALDLTGMSQVAGRKVDMVLGREMLSGLAVVIHPGRRYMRIATSGKFKTPPQMATVPLIDGDTVDAMVNGRTVRLKIDLGLSGAALLTDAAWDRVFAGGTPVVTQTTFQSADGASHPARATRTMLTIGLLSSADAPVGSGYMTDEPIDGLLGAGILLKSVFLLDLGAKKLLVGPLRVPAGAQATEPAEAQ